AGKLRRGSGRRHGRPNGRQGAHTRGRRPPHSTLIGREGVPLERVGEGLQGSCGRFVPGTPPEPSSPQGWLLRGGDTAADVPCRVVSSLSNNRATQEDRRSAAHSLGLTQP